MVHPPRNEEGVFCTQISYVVAFCPVGRSRVKTQNNINLNNLEGKQVREYQSRKTKPILIKHLIGRTKLTKLVIEWEKRNEH